MQRLLSLAVTLCLLAAAVVPIVAQQDDAIGAFCPLASRQVTDELCIGEACPCHHAPQGFLSPVGMKARAPESQAAVGFALDNPRATYSADPRFAPGFPASIDHPPDQHD